MQGQRFIVVSALACLLWFCSPTARAVCLPAPAQPTPAQKEWTFLVYLNGNNNLDRYTFTSLKEMEAVGSTPDMNIVVQWASLSRRSAQRIYIENHPEPFKIFSPVLQDLGLVDMGDPDTLSDFLQWGIKNYPARHYFIDIWNHGSGWHEFKTTDISRDDLSGNAIRTVELGQVMAKASQQIGHPVDILGADACLMAMVEVTTEVAPYVDYFAASQAEEPGTSWPYNKFLRQWIAQKDQSPRQIASILGQTYINHYRSQKIESVTFSVSQMSGQSALNEALRALGQSILYLSTDSKRRILTAARNTQHFVQDDYIDLLDFLDQPEMKRLPELAPAIASVRSSAKNMILFNEAALFNSRANGLSIWLPLTVEIEDLYKNIYSNLRFHQQTQWGNVVEALVRYY